MIRTLILILGLATVLSQAVAVVPAGAQASRIARDRLTEAAPELPRELIAGEVDTLVAGLTDAEIRALLLTELRRRAEEQAADDAATDATLMEIGERLSVMAATIEERVVRWADALANIGDRRERIAERIALARGGVGGMLLGALVVFLAGVGAALGVAWLTRPWRRWLATPERADYWDRVVRTLALGALELGQVFAFVLATVTMAPLVADRLGPLVDYVWIYHAGVSWSWAAIIVVRRAFEPDAPALRIAPVGDGTAEQITQTLTLAIRIGAAGWLIAGLSPTLGAGFPPALVTVAIAGTVVAGLLLVAVIRNRLAIRSTLAEVVGTGAGGVGPRIAIAAGPVLLGLYIVVAWVYWLAHWLERGVQRLDGPAGTLAVLLVLPIVDRLGAECVRTALPAPTPAAERYRSALRGAWRMLLGIAAVFVVASLWGLDLLALAKGPEAAPWASMLFDIAVTLLIGQLIWRLIRAALYRPPRVAAGAEDADVELPAASRLDTLVPLLRNVLLGILAIVVAMIVLSTVGVDIGPLLASAGIVGIAIGFGAQNLVRDVFSGAFFLIDDAFRVGEYIELEQDLRGEVEAITVRSLQLRHHKGAVITIPFGEVKRVINHNRDWVIYKMNFRLEPETDPNVVKKTVKTVGAELLADPEHGPKFLEPLKSQGVLMIDDDSALVIRVKFKCRPRAQFVLRREVHHRLREAFAEKGILFARRKVEVVSHGADGSATPIALPDDVIDPARAARGPG